MNKEVEGIVIEARGEFAKVRPTSNAGSVDCACHDGGLSETIIEARNGIKAVVGDKVIFEDNEEGTLIAAFMIFIFPLILVSVGAAAGYYLSEFLRINSTLASFIGGTLFFVIALLIIRMHDRSVSKNRDMVPVITRITNKNYLS